MPPTVNPSASIKERIANTDGLPRCTVPGCTRPTMAATGVGLSEFRCKAHNAHRARHGSEWCPTYKASDLKPFLQVSAKWIKERRTETSIAHALIGLKGLLDGSGEALPAQDIKRHSAASRARVAFARLREANVKPERLLAIHMAVSALIEDDLGSHRVPEFRIVQVAKCAHRLASGTHRHWDWPLDNGTTAPLAFHAYPKSSGRVLRVIGGELEEICAGVSERDLQAIRNLKLARFGPHPSRLPGWRPLWARQRDGGAAMKSRGTL